MFAGKTTQLIRTVQMCMRQHLRCLVVKFSGDTRYHSELLASHDKIFLHLQQQQPHSTVSRDAENSSNSEYVSCAFLGEIPLDKILLADVLVIDEAHLFPDIYTFIVDTFFTATAAAAKSSIRIFVAGLDSWHTLEPCTDVLALVPYAQYVAKYRATCSKCGRRNAATCTYKKKLKKEDNNATPPPLPLVDIGGPELYSALCMPCYFSSCCSE